MLHHNVNWIVQGNQGFPELNFSWWQWGGTTEQVLLIDNWHRSWTAFHWIQLTYIHHSGVYALQPIEAQPFSCEANLAEGIELWFQRALKKRYVNSVQTPPISHTRDIHRASWFVMPGNLSWISETTHHMAFAWAPTFVSLKVNKAHWTICMNCMKCDAFRYSAQRKDAPQEVSF